LRIYWEICLADRRQRGPAHFRRRKRPQRKGGTYLDVTGGPIYGAVDLVGATGTATLAMGALRKGGHLVLVGLYGGEVPLSIVPTIQRALTIQGSYVGTLAELKEVVALARDGKLKQIPIEQRPLEKVSDALDQLKAGTVVGRVVAQI